MQLCGVGQQPRHRGLACAGRAPEHQRAERARFQHAGEYAVGAEQMVLPHHLVELLRTEFIGERPRRILVEAGGGKQIRARLGARAHPLNTAEIFCPPRIRSMRQLAPGVLALRSRSRVVAMRSPLTLSTISPRWKPRLLA